MQSWFGLATHELSVGKVAHRMCVLSVLFTWSARRWRVAALTAVGTFLLLGLSTAVIPNPVFGRSIPPTSWALGVLVATSVLSGLLTASYIRQPSGSTAVSNSGDRPARGGIIGGALAYFAIGCPVCNKLVLLALGATGAVQFFAPIQPYMAAAGMLLLAGALVIRLRGAMRCAWAPPASHSPATDVTPASPETSQPVVITVGGESESSQTRSHHPET